MQRPFIATFFGIGHIVVGALGLLMCCCNAPVVVLPMDGSIPEMEGEPLFELMSDQPVFFAVVVGKVVVGIIVYALTIFAGVGLLRGSAWSRVLSNLYGGYGVGMSLLNAVVLAGMIFPHMAASDPNVPDEPVMHVISATLIFTVMVIYPAAALVFVNLKGVKDWLDPQRPRGAYHAPVGPVIEPWDR